MPFLVYIIFCLSLLPSQLCQYIFVLFEDYIFNCLVSLFRHYVTIRILGYMETPLINVTDCPFKRMTWGLLVR